jgi:DNA-binding CsgD family transcriptional regulator
VGGCVGRDQELVLLRGLVSATVAGRGGAVLIEGEPGIGKTTLVREVFTSVEPGCSVLWGAADELGQPIPFGVVLNRLDVEPRSPDPRRAGLAGLRGNADASSPEPVGLGVERLLPLVDELSGNTPLVVVMEDLQWADGASLLLWHRLTHIVGQHPLLLMATVRPTPVRREITEIRRWLHSRDYPMLTLGPLADDDVDRLVEARVGAAPKGRLAVLTQLAGGNPLYATELVDALVREGDVRVESGRADVAVDREPLSLDEAIADRLSSLSAPTTRMLRVAALLGTEFTVKNLSIVAGASAADLLPMVEEARRGGVLQDAGPRLRFRHGLIQHALYGQMPESVRAAMHGQAAKALADAALPARRVAEQLLPAVRAGVDSWAVDWLIDNAETVTFQAPQVATELLEAALSDVPPADPRRDLVLYHLGSSLVLLGRTAEALTVHRQVNGPLKDPILAMRLVMHLAVGLTATQHDAETQTLLEQALTQADLPAGHASAFHSQLAWGHLKAGRWNQAEAAATEALAAAEQAGLPVPVGLALNILALTTAQRGDYVTVAALLERTVEMMERAGTLACNPARLNMAGNWIAVLITLGRIAQAEDVVRRTRVVANGLGAPFQFTPLPAQLHLHMGRWDEVLAEIDPIAGGAEIEIMLHSIAALIAVHRDDDAALHSHLDALPGGQVDDREIVNSAEYMLLARALAAERDGHPRQTLAMLAPTVVPHLGARPFLGWVWQPRMVRLALDVGDFRMARAAAASSDESTVRQPDSPILRSAAAHARGLLDGDPAPLLAAAGTYRQLGLPLELGQVLEDAAVLLAKRGRAAEARTIFAETIACYTGLEAAWDIRRAESRMRPLGIRRGPRGRRSRAAHGWDSLTPAELTIARLVAEGLSNARIAERLMLSQRTVEVHVGHILNKIDGRSRTDIAGEMIRRGGAQHSAGAAG